MASAPRDWLGDSLKPGKHTIEFEFNYDGPGIAKGGTGVLKVDGRVLATEKLEHTIPFLLPPDETFDVGVDTRTPVDSSYDIPFRFNGKIDRLTFKLGPTQLAEADRKSRCRKPSPGRRGRGSTVDRPTPRERQHARNLLEFAAIVEIGTGLALMIDPRFVVGLLVGPAPAGRGHSDGPVARDCDPRVGSVVLAGWAICRRRFPGGPRNADL